MRISDWSSDVCSSDLLGELERLMLQATYGEYLSQLTGGIALSQVEVLRPGDLGMSDAEVAALATPAVRRLTGNGNALRMAIAGHLAEGRFGEAGLADDTLEMIRDQLDRQSTRLH